MYYRNRYYRNANMKPATTVAYSLQQIQLQSLLISDLVPFSRKEFATSLAYWNKRPLSESQVQWVGKILQESVDAAEAKVNAPAAETIDIQNILKLFETAKKYLKYPKVWLRTRNNQEVKMTILSQNSKHPGSLSMAAGSYGSLYFGCIGKDGTLRLTKSGLSIKTDLLDLLKEFNADPAGVASAHGKLTSRCCFCGLPLSTPESMAVGYGDTCAKHYHLDWGTKKFSKSDVIQDFRTQK